MTVLQSNWVCMGMYAAAVNDMFEKPKYYKFEILKTMATNY